MVCSTRGRPSRATASPPRAPPPARLLAGDRVPVAHHLVPLTRSRYCREGRRTRQPRVSVRGKETGRACKARPRPPPLTSMAWDRAQSRGELEAPCRAAPPPRRHGLELLLPREGCSAWPRARCSHGPGAAARSTAAAQEAREAGAAPRVGPVEDPLGDALWRGRGRGGAAARWPPPRLAHAAATEEPRWARTTERGERVAPPCQPPRAAAPWPRAAQEEGWR